MTKDDWQRFYKILETYRQIAAIYAAAKGKGVRAGTEANANRTASTSSTKGVLIIKNLNYPE